MNANTRATPKAPGDGPIQDKVSEPAANGPGVGQPAATVPAVNPAVAQSPAAHVSGPEHKAPPRPKGPNASAIVLGLLAMIFGGLTIAKETMGWHVDWSRLGPGGIIGIGVLMVVIGAVGLARRHDDV